MYSPIPPGSHTTDLRSSPIGAGHRRRWRPRRLLGAALCATALAACDRQPASIPEETPPPIAATDIAGPAPAGIWISAEALASLPTSGPAWEALADEASDECDAVELENQSSSANVCVMAKALVAARTGDRARRAEVLEALSEVAATSGYSGSALALGRELTAYVIAADLIGLAQADPDLDRRFRATLRTLLHVGADGGGVSSLTECHEVRPNNWGTHCGASRAAVAAYLGDRALLERVARVFKGWLGDRSAYADFRFGRDRSWQCDPEQPRGINPAGCQRGGHSIDGVLPDDQRRGGGFAWPPRESGRVYDALQGALAMAVLLERQGYDPFSWEDQALLRAFTWLHTQAGSPPEGDDAWQPHVVNHAYGTTFDASVPARPGKNVGWTDWTHGSAPDAVRRAAPPPPPSGSDPEPPPSDPPSSGPPEKKPSPPPANEPPRARAEVRCSDLECTFDGTGSSDPEGGTLTYRWDFGDGASATGSRASHTYGSAGEYRVTLRVSDPGGAQDETSSTVRVSAPAPPPPPPPSAAPPAPSGGLWVSASDIAALPTSGAGWDRLTSAASGSCGSPDLADQDDGTNVCVLAKALVHARTGNTGLRGDVVAALRDVARSGRYSGRALALGRELIAYVIAADVIGLSRVDAGLDREFRDKIRSLLTAPTSSGPGSLVECHEERPNNWGTHCGASRAAVAAYLGDRGELDRVARVFRGWLGDRSAYAGFRYGDLSWQCDSSRPVGINPRGCTRNGRSLDGVLPDDQRRGGGFSWPPPRENYVYEGLQGALATAVILHQQGYDAFSWEDQALLRAFRWLHEQAGYRASGDDTWQPHVVNHYYGTNFPAPSPSSPGKNVGWTDWTHR